jgi:hypothetical protein
MVLALNREAILGKTTLRRELVQVPEWGGAVYVREITGAERDRYEQSLITESHDRKGRTTRSMRLADARARLVALAACDAEGKALFTESDVPQLGKLSAAALDRVFTVASRLAGLSDQDVEELAGN